MSARAVLDQLKAHNITIAPSWNGKLSLGPEEHLTPELLEAVHLHKTELLQLLTWDPDAAAAMLRATVIHVGRSANGQPSSIHEHIAHFLAEYGPIIAGLFAAQNLEALRCCLLDLERNISDAMAGRGCDNRPACPVCRGSCQWCNTLGIISCGACLGLGRRK
jgi:hypothetical protein